jgi:hypothetical protein
MDRVIEQFMWGFQHHFRNGLERVARDVFAQIGFGIGARAYLIGFTSDKSRSHAICVEPESEAIANIDLTGVVSHGAKLYEEHPDSNMFITSPRHHERHHSSLQDWARGEALRLALEADPGYLDRYFFVGASALVGGAYDVHPVLSVPRARWDQKPRLHGDRIHRYRATPSLQHAVIDELLRAATTDLRGAEAPEDFSLAWGDRSELVRKAARQLVQSVSVRAGYEFASELLVALNEVSAQAYEGRTGIGRIVLATAEHPAIDMHLSFVEPVRLTQTRAVRKALEMTDREHHLLCDGEKLLGLASPTSRYNPATEAIFNIDVVSRGAWEIRHHETPLLRITNTRPMIPAPRIEEAQFNDTVLRIFPECEPDDVKRIWDLATAAADAEHGTMLVVHRTADAEAQRLRPQSQRVQPAQLSRETLSTVTNIDGAVLIDPRGQCHAVGVILDGEATGTGDASRGARYNSAVRYEHAQAGHVLVIVVSEDGMINLQPRLRRRIPRERSDVVIDALEVEVAKENPNYESFFRNWEHLEALAFYLSVDQCRRANDAREQLEQHRATTSAVMIGWARLEPDPEMSDDYFLD